MLQFRVNRALVSVKKPGTLPGARANERPMDPNFKNTELEWVIYRPMGSYLREDDGLLLYGFMFRDKR